jgi:hypothetical protein
VLREKGREKRQEKGKEAEGSRRRHELRRGRALAVTGEPHSHRLRLRENEEGKPWRSSSPAHNHGGRRHCAATAVKKGTRRKENELRVLGCGGRIRF